MRQPVVAGNWKMNGSRSSIQALLGGIKKGISEIHSAEVVVCPPFVYIADVAQQLEGTSISWGAQDLNQHDSGAYTGEVSGPMLNDFQCKYVILGHSERRHIYGESDQLVAEKFQAAYRLGLYPILCVGELLEEREDDKTDEVVARQLDAVLDIMGGASGVTNSIIAYEPVWAIGTGKTASPQQAQAVHQMIRERLAGDDPQAAAAMRILYGGSVNAGNAAELFSMVDIDGGLIGGASLKSDDFLAICRAAG